MRDNDGGVTSQGSSRRVPAPARQLHGAAPSSEPTPYDGRPASATTDGTSSGPTIIIEDEVLRQGFTQLPNFLFQIRGLSHGAKLAYALILSYAWQGGYCFPGQETLARDLEVSTRSVIEYLKELQASGLIRIQRRGLGMTNIYHVLRYPPTPREPETPPSHPEVKKTAHQDMRPASHQEVAVPSDPDPHSIAHQDVQPSSRKKDASQTKLTVQNAEQQTQGAERAAVVAERSRKGQMHVTRTSGAPALEFQASSDTPAHLAQQARAGLTAQGVKNSRLLKELTADPAEALRQMERLRDAMAQGDVLNPTGWLVEAIRGRYGNPESAAPIPLPFLFDGVADERDARPNDVFDTRAAVDDPADSTAPTESPAGAWARVCAELRATQTRDNYQRWFGPSHALDLAGDVLTVSVPDSFHQQWLDRRLRPAIERAAARTLDGVRIAFVVAPA